jgi:hypothetical protein
MKEPVKIKLTDAPSSKTVEKIPLKPIKLLYDDYGYITAIKPLEHENNSQNNSEGLQ